MIKLTSHNIPNYLQQLNIFPNFDPTKTVIREVTQYTNVNFVFSAKINSQKFKKIFLKQAFGFVKIKPDFPAPIERQLFEKLTIDYLQKYWKGRIPEVIHYDNKNNVLIMTDVGENAFLLADEIKNGRGHFEIGADLGKMMAELHYPTYNINKYPVRDKNTNQEHVDFIFDFRLRGAREVAKKDIDKLFEESKAVKTSMIYGDWASKNVFVADNKVRLVDFENFVRFDPAFDIGYALAHWVLDISKDNLKHMIRFFKDFEKAYSESWSGKYTDDLKSILERSSKYTGAMMLHRLTGVKNTNRMKEYLNRDINLIDLAKDILTKDNDSPSDALLKLKI